MTGYAGDGERKDDGNEKHDSVDLRGDAGRRAACLPRGLHDA